MSGNEGERVTERDREESYRRGYQDGYLEALEDMHDEMFEKRIARQSAYGRLWDWAMSGELWQWLRGDCSKIEFPPAFRG